MDSPAWFTALDRWAGRQPASCPSQAAVIGILPLHLSSAFHPALGPDLWPLPPLYPERPRTETGESQIRPQQAWAKLPWDPPS